MIDRLVRPTLVALALTLALPACAQAPIEAAAAPAPAQAATTVVLLGTAGGPPPQVGRAQPATLVIVAGRKFLIDVGEGATYQLMQAGVPPTALEAVLLTHLHWDHTLGLDALMATDWMRGRKVPLPIYGPVGTAYLVKRQTALDEVGYDIFKSQAPGRPPLDSLYPVHELGCGPLEVFKDAAVTVTAVCNSHFAEVHGKPHSYGPDTSLSYRFDTRHGSVTFTGDTGPSPALERLAAGSDVLVSEIVDVASVTAEMARAEPNADMTRLNAHMAHQHLTAEEVGKLATRVGVKKVVLTHFVAGRTFDKDSFAAQVRRYFAGEVVVGRDLMRFDL